MCVCVCVFVCVYSCIGLPTISYTSLTHPSKAKLML